MKQRFLSLLIVFILPVVLINCAEKKDNNSSSAGTTPLTTNCLTGQANCNNSVYGQYPGFYPYPTNNYQNTYNPYQSSYNPYAYQQQQSSFCGCGYSAQPVYNNSLGMGCVYNQVVAPVATLMGFWSLAAANTQWINTPQNSNMVNTNSNGCSSTVGQACFSNQANTCGDGMTCRSSANSNLGVCLRNQ